MISSNPVGLMIGTKYTELENSCPRETIKIAQILIPFKGHKSFSSEPVILNSFPKLFVKEND